MNKILAFLSVLLVSQASFAAGDYKEPKQVQWPFSGVTGKFDEPSIQRGFQAYKEVCAACHGVKRVAFRNLQEVGFSEAEVKVLASQYNVKDGPDEFGEMFDRPGRPSDRIPAPYPNKQAAQAANNGSYPPDLSLMVKARKDGANYIYSLLTGYYDEVPEGVTIPEGKHYNPYFPGKAIAMARPVVDGQITYSDGTEATTEQVAKDIVNFLQWTAEPEMQTRKQMGIKVILFLVFFTVFFYIAKRRIWSRIGQ